MEFSLSTLRDRLKEGGLDQFKISLEREIWEQTVSRAFMSSVYGGGAQNTFPDIGQAKFAEHGIRHFMYVNSSLHVHAPGWPGNPGLFFDCEGWDDQGRIHKTFARIEPSKWNYVGDYVLVPVEPLRTREWNEELSEKVSLYIVVVVLVFNCSSPCRPRLHGSAS